MNERFGLHRRRRSPGLGLLCLVLLCAACRSREPREERVRRAREGKGDLVIAAAWPWELRKEIRYGEGLQMAVDEVNASGGIRGRRLRLARYDDRESINQGRIVAQQISADPDVVAVIGHLQSYITVQTAGVYDQAGLVLVAPTATDPKLTQLGYKRAFRATFTDNSVGRQLADLVASQQRKNVAVYYIRNDYGRNVANAFEERARQLGVAVQARNSYDPSEQASERTFDQVLTEWKPLGLDAILLAGEVPSAAIFVAQARRKGIDVAIFGGDAMSSPALMAVAGAAAEGTTVASYFSLDEPRPEVVRFNTAFTAKFGAPPDAGSALGYDCVMLLAHAMKEARSAAPEDVTRSLHALKGWHGTTRVFSFDEAGDAAKPVIFSVVRDGRFVYLPATATPASPTPPTGSGARDGKLSP
ncbi:MAG: ABC transporter substrate-binding protein [Myxococcales bacterium]|nr:ABC transporter substrate-binding protein [Myxococcales bacterium]